MKNSTKKNRNLGKQKVKKLYNTKNYRKNNYRGGGGKKPQRIWDGKLYTYEQFREAYPPGADGEHDAQWAWNKAGKSTDHSQQHHNPLGTSSYIHTDFGASSTPFGAGASGFGAGASGFGAGASGFGAGASGFGAGASGFGAGASGFGAGASGFGAGTSASGFGAGFQSPSFGVQSLGLGEGTSTPSLTAAAASSSSVEPFSFCQNIERAKNPSVRELFSGVEGVEGCSTTALHMTCPLCASIVSNFSPMFIENLKKLLRTQFLQACQKLILEMKDKRNPKFTQNVQDLYDIIERVIHTPADQWTPQVTAVAADAILKCDRELKPSPTNMKILEGTTDAQFNKLLADDWHDRKLLEPTNPWHLSATEETPELYYINPAYIDTDESKITANVADMGTEIAKLILCDNTCAIAVFDRWRNNGGHFFNIGKEAGSNIIWAIDAYHVPGMKQVPDIQFPVNKKTKTLKQYLMALGGPNHIINNMGFVLTQSQVEQIYKQLVELYPQAPLAQAGEPPILIPATSNERISAQYREIVQAQLETQAAAEAQTAVQQQAQQHVARATWAQVMSDLGKGGGGPRNNQTRKSNRKNKKT